MAVDVGYAFLITFCVILVIFGGFYVWAYLKKNYNTVDIAYGVAFPLAAILMSVLGGNFSGNAIIVILMVVFWGARFAVMLTLRKYGKDEQTGENRRFKVYHDQFGPAASWKGFIYLYIPQALLVMVVGFPVYAATYEAIAYGWQFFTGLAIWVCGFAFELIADLQLWKFKQNKANKGKIMQTGLWKYSMHPNYFGEILQWVGFFFIGLTSPRPWFQVIGLLSPITIWVSLLFFSGIPLLDKRYSNNEVYQEYRRNTNRLVPWFKKSAYSRKD